MTQPYNFQFVRDQLKDFQKATVDVVCNRFLRGGNTDRFLVADEVGLGKTLVAKGVIARTIEHLHKKGVKRIDIVYLCSNAEIARQNVDRLNFLQGRSVGLASRMTLLPRELPKLKGSGVNFISFTPGTSFDFAGGSGIVAERVLLYWLLRRVWGKEVVKGIGALRALQGGVRHTDTFKRRVEEEKGFKFSSDLTTAFKQHLREYDKTHKGSGSLKAQFKEICQWYTSARWRRTKEHHSDRGRIVGDLRRILAKSCVGALEPDLVIFDEFQRFKHLLAEDTPGGELANRLLDYQDADTGHRCKVLLLSATPYKMYTLPEETAAGEDHYADFLRTQRFLLGDEGAETLRRDLASFSQALLAVSSDLSAIGRAEEAKGKIERRLRGVMARTERLASSADRGGMLKECVPSNLTVDAADLKSFVALDSVARLLGASDIVEYWKSSPYLLNLMEDYKLKRSFNSARHGPAKRQGLSRLLPAAGLLSEKDVAGYRRVDSSNARLRSLVSGVLDCGAWQLLWLPPALPYYASGAPFDNPELEGFTKRLIFSSWQVVPKAIATLVSYEAERRIMTSEGRKRARNTAEARAVIRPLLRMNRSKGRVAGMPVLAMLYPSPALAVVGDPLRVASEHPDRLLEADEVLDIVSKRMESILEPFLVDAPTEGQVDEAWYWAVPFLLDAEAQHGNEWLQSDFENSFGSGDDSDEDQWSDAWWAHFYRAQEMSPESDARRELGKPPDDLAEVSALLAVGAFGTAMLRTLSRVAGGHEALEDPDLRTAAVAAAVELRNLFNVPEAIRLLRAGRRRNDRTPYWRLVLEYAVRGNIQAVLDEYAHVLPEQLGAASKPPEVVAKEVAKEMTRSISLRAAVQHADVFQVNGSAIKQSAVTFRARFAARFRTEEAYLSEEVTRPELLRAAFNSPFWPFVLASTSVGQEGLDFHNYCHAVVHWNLPTNPVDLEQREGRVHRYKGHAVRKNVAAQHRDAALTNTHNDPWAAVFDSAASERGAGENELRPYWLYPIEDGAKIERHVLAIPTSRDEGRARALRRTLGAYRMLMGQPRQEDFLNYLATFAPADIEDLAKRLRVDLAPR